MWRTSHDMCVGVMPLPAVCASAAPTPSLARLNVQLRRVCVRRVAGRSVRVCARARVLCEAPRGDTSVCVCVRTRTCVCVCVWGGARAHTHTPVCVRARTHTCGLWQARREGDPLQPVCAV